MPINLGQITFGIGADTTRLGASITEIQRFGTAVASVSSGVATSTQGIEAAFRKQEAAMISALGKVQRYQDAVARLEAPTRITQGLNQISTRGLDQLVARMASGQLSAIQFQREMERFNATMNNAQRIMTNFAEAQKRADANSMVASLQKLSSATVLVAGPLSGIATRISVIANLADHFSIAWAGAIAGIAAGAYAFYKLSTATIAAEKQLQSISATFQAVYGNMTIANLQMSYLRDLSDRSGISIGVLGKQFAQFEAAAKGTVLEGERTRTVFEAVAFATQKLGLSTEEAEGALRAIQQMVSKGTIQMEELKGQLGDRLPGAVQIMAKALDVTVPKLNEMAKKGEIGASALTKFAEALKSRYNIDTSQRVDSIVAAEGRLNTARMAALDSLDKLIGFSSAYKNTLDFITNAINGATSNSKVLVQQFLQVGVALAAAFAGPMILAGIEAMARGIIGLSRAIAAVNAASALGALTSFARVLAVLAVAVGAYYGSGELIDRALAKNTESFLNAKPAVEDYIAAQQKLVSSVREPTKQYIAETEKVLKAAEEQQKAILGQAQAMVSWSENMEKAGLSAEQVKEQLSGMFPKNLGTQYEQATEKVEKLKKTIADLYVILARQTEAENSNRTDPIKELTNRQKVSIEKAEENIRNLKEKFANLYLAPGPKQFKDTQEEINHSVETFKENLERAEIPAAKIKTLVEGYRKAFSAFKEGENAVKNFVSAFQFAADMAKKFGDTAITNLVDVMVDGKDKMAALQDTAKQTVRTILNEFLKLAALHPMLNALFGTNYQTLGGSGGVGGLLGNLLGGSGTSTVGSVNYGGISVPTVGFAEGGIMTSMGPLPLRKYASGGIADSPQAAIYGEGSQNEAFVPLPDGRRIPVALQGALAAMQGSKVQVNVINQSKDVVATHNNYRSGDIDVHDIVVQSVSKGFIDGEFAGISGRRTKRR